MSELTLSGADIPGRLGLIGPRFRAEISKLKRILGHSRSEPRPVETESESVTCEPLTRLINDQKVTS